MFDINERVWYNRDGKLTKMIITDVDIDGNWFKYEVCREDQLAWMGHGWWTREEFLLSEETVGSDLFKAVYDVRG